MEKLESQESVVAVVAPPSQLALTAPSMEYPGPSHSFDDLMGMGVSKNSGTPKWMVYKGKPY